MIISSTLMTIMVIILVLLNCDSLHDIHYTEITPPPYQK